MAGDAPEGPQNDLGGIAAHPLRRRILDYLSAREASPSEMATAFGLDVEDVAYHVRRLRDLGAVWLVGERPARGSVRHTYRAPLEEQCTLKRSEGLSPRDRAVRAQLIAELGAADVAAALRAGFLGAAGSDRFARLSGPLDDEGLAELRRIQLDAERRILETLTKAKSRVGKGEGETHRFVRVVTMSLQVPDPDLPLE